MSSAALWVAPLANLFRRHIHAQGFDRCLIWDQDGVYDIVWGLFRDHWHDLIRLIPVLDAFLIGCPPNPILELMHRPTLSE